MFLKFILLVLKEEREKEGGREGGRERKRENLMFPGSFTKWPQWLGLGQPETHETGAQMGVGSSPGHSISYPNPYLEKQREMNQVLGCSETWMYNVVI